ncbi:MAG: TolC family protein, partial [Longimicrobiaceae bacterium]
RNMNRGIYQVACVLTFAAASLGAAAAAAQDIPLLRTADVAGDTLTLSLAEAQRLALAQNPAFLAERQETVIARGELRQARVYNFNPQLSFDAPGAATNGSLGEYEASLSQEIEIGGQRGLRIRAAGFGVERAAASVRDAARQTVAEASEAFYTALIAQRRLRLADEVLALNERLLDAVRVQLREGEISALEGNLAEIEFGRARARVLAARRETSDATLELKRLTGIAPEQPVRLAEELPQPPPPAALDPDSLVALALARRPDLTARVAATRELQALTAAARRGRVPNLRIGALAERSVLDNEPRLGIGVGFGIPLFDRNQGIIAQRQARAEQAVLEGRAVELRIRTGVTRAYRAYVAASEEAAVLEESVLQPARANQALLETAYRAGKIDLPTLLLLRNQLLDAEIGYLDAALARRQALVDLQAATATLAVEDIRTPLNENGP